MVTKLFLENAIKKEKEANSTNKSRIWITMSWVTSRIFQFKKVKLG